MRTFWPVTVAALADIHGNVQALDAVLADPRLPEQIVVLGDVVAGTFPAESYDRLAQLGTRVRILRGNADRIVLERSEKEAQWAYDRLGPDRVAAVGRWPFTFAVSTDAFESPVYALIGAGMLLVLPLRAALRSTAGRTPVVEG